MIDATPIVTIDDEGTLRVDGVEVSRDGAIAALLTILQGQELDDAIAFIDQEIGKHQVN